MEISRQVDISALYNVSLARRESDDPPKFRTGRECLHCLKLAAGRLLAREEACRSAIVFLGSGRSTRRRLPTRDRILE